MTVSKTSRPTQHVAVQRAKRGDVQARRRLRLVPQNPVEDREQGGLRLPDPGRGDEEDVRAGENPRNRTLLGFRERLDPEGLDRLENPGIKPKALHARRFKGRWD